MFVESGTWVIDDLIEPIPFENDRVLRLPAEKFDRVLNQGLDPLNFGLTDTLDSIHGLDAPFMH